MTLLELFLEDVKRRGGRGAVVPAQSEGVSSNGALTIPTTGVSIRPRGNRTSILIVNQEATGGNFAKAKLGGGSYTASTAPGIILDPSGGFVLFDRDKDGEAVTQAVHLVADTGNVAAYVYELEAE